MWKGEGMKIVKNNNWKKLRQLEWKTCNFLWWIISELAFLSLWYQTVCNPGSLDTDRKMETLWWSFWEIWCQRFFLTITISVSHNWDQRGRIRERIVFDSQHQIVFQLNFYFYTVRPGIDLQKSERIFLLTLKTCPWKSDILSPKLGKNPTILVKKLPIGQNSLQVEDRKLEMTYLHLHFAFVQRQVSNRGKWIFCQRFQEFSLFSPRFEQIYSLLIMENIMFKSFVWLLAHFILCRSYLDPLCMYQPHTYSTLTTY